MVTPPRQRPFTDDRGRFLDELAGRLRDGDDTVACLDTLSDGLWWFRKQDDPTRWKAWASAALSHRMREIVHEDPFTCRSYAKPRGYPGDAELLDLIYYDQGFANLLGVSDVGSRVFWRNRDAPAPRAVRERRDHLAALIDRTALRAREPRVLSVAAGHLREGLKSAALQAGRIAQFVALDQDPASLEVVRAAFGYRVTPLSGSIRLILSGGLAGEQFDLIYAAGLYDYLADRIARALTTALFDLLAPGGELVIANFVPDILDAGYMETYMGWNLTYRAPQELACVAVGLAAPEGVSRSLYFLTSPEIAYLAVRRG